MRGGKKAGLQRVADGTQELRGKWKTYRGCEAAEDQFTRRQLARCQGYAGKKGMMTAM